MRTVFKPLFAAALLLAALPLSAQRGRRSQDPTLNRGEGLEKSRADLDKMRNQNQNKNAREISVYMLATSFSLLDSTYYVSDIQFVEDVAVNNKWFIQDRLDYEKQFKDYIGGGDSYMTSVIFSDKKNKILKDRARIIKRNKRTNGLELKEMSGFRFTKPVKATTEE